MKGGRVFQKKKTVFSNEFEEDSGGNFGRCQRPVALGHIHSTVCNRVNGCH